MSTSVTYAAAISTPNGTLRQPQIQAHACSDPDLRSSCEEAKAIAAKPQRPGAGIRAKTSFRGWASKKPEHSSSHLPGPVREIQHDSEQFSPRSEHTPNTQDQEECVYVLTLKVTDDLATPMNEFRQRYFPRKLNRTPAHLTLFHALPHSQLSALEASLCQTSSTMQPFLVSSGKPFRMRRGVGVNVDEGYKTLKDVHEQLRSQWVAFLSEQDAAAGGFRPHWTVMNKVDDERKVDDAFQSVRRELSEKNQEGKAMGLELWRYNRGDWEWAGEYLFGSEGKGVEMMQGKGDDLIGQSIEGTSNKRPGMWKRGSSVGDKWRSMSFRKKS